MHDVPTTHPGRYIPFKREGWGTALFVVLLALGTAAAATYVHRQTYKHPTDVRNRAAGADTPAPAAH